MEKYKVKDWVWSTRLQMAVEVIPYYDSNVLFSCSLDAANKWFTIYTRYASGNEIFDTLSHRERFEAKAASMLDNLRKSSEED
jgi:hypothetical protein